MCQCLLANTMISLFGHLFFMVPLVWLVIIVETVFIKKATHGSVIRAFASSTLANLYSTFLGFPVTWFLCVILSIPIYSMGSVLEKSFGIESNIGRILDLTFSTGIAFGIPGHVRMFATIFLLIPYYYMSVFLENQIVKRVYTDIDPGQIKKAVIRMNRVTYLLLGGLMLAIFILGELADR